MGRQYLFKPNDEEETFIYENIESWTNYCRNNLKRDIRNTRFNKWNQASIYLLLVSIGFIISLIGLVVIAPSIVIMGIFILGGVLVVFGTYGIIGVYKYG